MFELASGFYFIPDGAQNPDAMFDVMPRTPAGAEAAPAGPHLLQIGMMWGVGAAAGGLDRVYTDLVKHLPDAGFRVTGVVWGPDDVAALSGGVVHGFAPADASAPRRYLAARRLIARLVRTERFDLVVAHFPLYAALALDRLRRLPMVVHFQGPWSGESAEEGEGKLAVAGKRAVETMVYRRAGRVIVLSKAFAELITSQFGVPEDRVRVVPGHADIDRFAPRQTPRQAREALAWPQDRPILLTVRRLRHRMGLDRLVAAMPRVVAAVSDVLLHIGGTGPLADALRLQIADAGLEDHVKLLGFVPEAALPLAYRAADFNVLTTVALEGFGLVAAEALAAGTPSLVTPIGGLPEVVAPLSPSLVFRSTAVDDIADGLIAALRGAVPIPDSEACSTYAAAHFGLAAAVAGVAAVYRDCLADGS
jgi:glycosyltransferase involved in cell wall biosynthesis